MNGSERVHALASCAGDLIILPRLPPSCHKEKDIIIIMSSDILVCLQALLDPNTSIRAKAEEHLKQFESQPGMFIKFLINMISILFIHIAYM